MECSAYNYSSVFVYLSSLQIVKICYNNISIKPRYEETQELNCI